METESCIYMSIFGINVSEGLNSVETTKHDVWDGSYGEFQKDLIVWKLEFI